MTQGIFGSIFASGGASSPPVIPEVPPILHTTMNDLDAVENPEIGSSGNVFGTGGSFVPAKFGNGFLVPNPTDTARIDYTNFAIANKGTVEFWIETTFNSTDVSSDIPVMFGFLTGSSLRITAQINQTAGNQGIDFFMFTGVSQTAVKYSPSYNAGEFHKFKFVFDGDGIDISSDQRQFYFDGVKQSRASGDLESKDIDVNLTLDLCISNISFANRGVKSIIDNFKFYDYANTTSDLINP